ncbi:MAG: element excision factor XisI family protein [Microcoleaceae cyanobacterium MO_207.B10]|nr:element excision factor XisI family protein [Microcoleaceae cyanobacterium MO_207.B10]
MERNKSRTTNTTSDRYLLLYVGWHDEQRIYGTPIHIDIKVGKIWIQRDLILPKQD